MLFYGRVIKREDVFERTFFERTTFKKAFEKDEL